MKNTKQIASGNEFDGFPTEAGGSSDHVLRSHGF